MFPQKEKGTCKCGWFERAAEDPKCPVEFDAELNEYHLVRGPKDYHMMYFCPFCGGRAPKSRSDRLFHTLTEAERDRLVNLTKEMRTIKDVAAAFGEADIKKPVGMVVTRPEREGKPEITQSYPELVYTMLSNIADVHVTVYQANAQQQRPRASSSICKQSGSAGSAASGGWPPWYLLGVRNALDFVGPHRN